MTKAGKRLIAGMNEVLDYVLSSDERVERVAQAIYGEYQRRAALHGWTVVGTVGWDELAESARKDYRATANAAICAIVEIDPERMRSFPGFLAEKAQ